MPLPDYNSSFDINYLFFFSLSYLVAISLFCLQLRRRRFFYIPLIITVAAVLVFGYFSPIIFFYGMPVGSIIAASMIFIGMCFIFDESIKTLISPLLLGVVANHSLFSLWSIVIINIDPFSSFDNDWAQLGSGFAFFILGYALIYFVFARRVSSAESIALRTPVQKIGSAIFVLAIIFLPSLCRTFNAESVFTRLYESLACFVYLFVELYINMQANSELEKARIEALLQNEEKQRALSEKSAEMVNIKAHDLKHKLSMLKANDASSAEEIEEMEEAIAQYDLLTNTGNKAFDAVVAEFAASMVKHKIKFTCIVDPEAISFMKPSDTYSFFANALSNAYEASRKVQDKGKRYIAMSIKKMGECVSIHIENYTQDIPDFHGGIPKTSKEDKESHGYGTKSMLYIAQKYNGHLTMNEHDGIFSVNAIFPLSGE